MAPVAVRLNIQLHRLNAQDPLAKAEWKGLMP